MRTIFLIDMQSFYASVEKVKNSHLWNHPVVVAGDPKKRNGIILAACPIAKTFGIKTAEPLWQAYQKCSSLHVVSPHMSLYIDVSYQITQLLEQYSDYVEVYSIDEQFVDVTSTERLFGNKYVLADSIRREIKDSMGIEAKIGMGPNKVLAKMACDHFAKKNETGIAELDPNHLEETLWPLPIGKLFGVGSRMQTHLTQMGLHTIGNLANYPVKWLKKRWGINGEVLWQLANGIDLSPVVPSTHELQKAIGHHMTLPHDYHSIQSIYVILLELSEEVARRVRKQNKIGTIVHVSVKGANLDKKEGFHRQLKLEAPTQLAQVIYKTAKQLFMKHWSGCPVRGLGIALGGLAENVERQLSFFDQPLEQEELARTIDDLKDLYGPTSVIKASSLFSDAQAHQRAKKIGGHDR
ncbi:DNA polymerase-4/DNA polymerase V [Pelagirhabdus alkalitolerans]|uniref:DNA polymerase IV n=1 Tax=Pelagirhabdus alkalitolerans TaxID=1612202 RepID=A0A1G6LUY7_9BACI|nr:DNA polymerase IV [Pelagirhabdus alkalitolerans]SDC47073.1 DNA polymerase-4/DNA polymerase V [Pelagirhabdus alkalitolerans]